MRWIIFLVYSCMSLAICLLVSIFIELGVVVSLEALDKDFGSWGDLEVDDCLAARKYCNLLCNLSTEKGTCKCALEWAFTRNNFSFALYSSLIKISCSWSIYDLKEYSRACWSNGELHWIETFILPSFVVFVAICSGAF